MPPVVATKPTESFSGKKMTTEAVVKELIFSLKKNRYTINVSIVKMLYLMVRLSPKTAFGILNTKEK